MHHLATDEIPHHVPVMRMSCWPAAEAQVQCCQLTLQSLACQRLTRHFPPSSFTHHLHTVTTTVLHSFSRTTWVRQCQKRNFWTSWCKGRLTEADTLTIRLGATPSGLTSAHLHHPPIFYRLDALPATQPTVSKHCSQLAHSD